MRKVLIILSVFLFLTAFTTLSDVWKNDVPHSQLAFTVTHLGVSDVSGTFNDFDVTITSKQPDFSDAVFELSADVSSIDTRVEARDNHLKSADFFDAVKFPSITFKSSSIKKMEQGVYKLTGDLTMHGITKQVLMDLRYKGSVENPVSKKQTVGFQLTGKLNRSDFNIGPNFPPPMISNEVFIKADGEFVK